MRTKHIVLALAMLITVVGKANAQDGSEYLLWEKTKDFAIRSIAFSPDETQLAVLGEYNWNADTSVIKMLSVQNDGEELFSITTKSHSTFCFYSPDGKYFFVDGNKETAIYDTKTYNLLKELPRGIISFSADNKLFSQGLDGYKFGVYNSETFEQVFVQNLPKPEADENGYYYSFFTPNGKYLVVNLGFTKKYPNTGSRTLQEIYDAKTFQKLDKQINCLKEFQYLISSSFSNNGLCVNTYAKEGSKSTQPIGFRIYDYDKDSLVWEQETKNYDGLIFLNTKNHLISRFYNYEEGNPDMRVFKSWNLLSKKQDKDIDCIPGSLQTLSKSDKYFCKSNGVSLWLYDFEKMFEGNVTVNEPNKSIEINITTNPDSNLIKIDKISNDITKIALYDLSGNLVDTIYKANTATNSIEYNTSKLSKGVYLIKIDTDKESFTKKIIIE
ncbi:MAG: T9SS type A sorting domain-containing protein [bacterium]